jgi:hypothetical protein
VLAPVNVFASIVPLETLELTLLDVLEATLEEELEATLEEELEATLEEELEATLEEELEATLEEELEATLEEELLADDELPLAAAGLYEHHAEGLGASGNVAVEQTKLPVNVCVAAKTPDLPMVAWCVPLIVQVAPGVAHLVQPDGASAAAKALEVPSAIAAASSV